MLTYNQKYKDDVLVGLNKKNGQYFDNSITDNGFFYTLGQKTGDSYPYNIDIYGFTLFCVKPDNILNLNDAKIKVNDDSGLITTGTLKGLSTNQQLGISFTFNTPLHVNPPKNVTFDNFEPQQGMTVPINGLTDKTNVLNFTATVNTPNNIKCNYTTGNHQFIKGQGVNFVFTGDLKKDDNITVKRNNRDDLIDTLKHDTDLLFISLGMDTSNTLEIAYRPTVRNYKCSLYPTLLNANVTDPALTESPSGAMIYMIDNNHPVITVKAKEGYSFENDGTLTYSVSNKIVYNTVIKANHSDTITINIPSDLNWEGLGVFKLTLGASKPDISQNAGGFTNIYKADYNALLSFSNEAINKITGDKPLDLSPYINNLIALPFNVPTGENASIVVGNETFKTQLPTVDNNYLTMDLGKIKVDEQYKNGFDYYQVKTRLMLPYTNLIELDPMHVINKTISIQYVVNVVNGDTTINVYSDNDLFLSQQVNLANEIPFISKATSGSQYAVINQLKTHFRNEINQAYIIIEQPTPILNADYYATNEKGTLKNYTGNVKVKLLNNVDINSNDLITLQNLLETGVNIK